MNRADIVALPKAHLHVHLEGAMRPSTVADLARRQGRPVPTLDGVDDLASFVAAYEGARGLVETRDDLRRVAREHVEDATAQGVVWSEVHLAPQSYRGRLGPDGAVVETVLEGIAEASGERAGAGLILGHLRTDAVDVAERVAVLAERYVGAGVVGLGLVGAERPGDAIRFREVFARARAAGLLSLPHAGEAAGPDAVRDALDVLGADRVLHGVTAVEDPRLVQRLVQERVCLDVCPGSNVRLGVVPDRTSHPLPDLVGAGVRVSLNSDDPTLFGLDLVDEYLDALDHGLTADDVTTIARTSLEASAAPPRLRRLAVG